MIRANRLMADFMRPFLAPPIAETTNTKSRTMSIQFISHYPPSSKLTKARLFSASAWARGELRPLFGQSAPLSKCHPHHDEIVISFLESAHRNKATLAEAPLGTNVPFQGPQMDGFQPILREYVVQEKPNGFSAIAMTPIGAVADHDAQLRLFGAFFYVEIGYVADMPSIERLDG